MTQETGEEISSSTGSQQVTKGKAGSLPNIPDKSTQCDTSDCF